MEYFEGLKKILRENIPLNYPIYIIPAFLAIIAAWHYLAQESECSKSSSNDLDITWIKRLKVLGLNLSKIILTIPFIAYAAWVVFKSYNLDFSDGIGLFKIDLLIVFLMSLVMMIMIIFTLNCAFKSRSITISLIYTLSLIICIYTANFGLILPDFLSSCFLLIMCLILVLFILFSIIYATYKPEGINKITDNFNLISYLMDKNIAPIISTVLIFSFGFTFIFNSILKVGASGLLDQFYTLVLFGYSIWLIEMFGCILRSSIWFFLLYGSRPKKYTRFIAYLARYTPRFTLFCLFRALSICFIFSIFRFEIDSLNRMVANNSLLFFLLVSAIYISLLIITICTLNYRLCDIKKHIGGRIFHENRIRLRSCPSGYIFSVWLGVLFSMITIYISYSNLDCREHFIDILPLINNVFLGNKPLSELSRMLFEAKLLFPLIIRPLWIIVFTSSIFYNFVWILFSNLIEIEL